MDNFFIKKHFTEDQLHLDLHGNIDENAEFIDLDYSSISKVILNLELVKAISSNGVRTWLKWINTAPKEVEIILINCPKIIVDQVNMVAGFLPENARLGSFYVPYFNQESGNEKLILFSEGKQYSKNHLDIPEEIVDESTGKTLELDVIEQSYFKFLK